VGTVWIAIASEEETKATAFSFFNDREANITRASVAALNMLRLEILGTSK
jgi:nicotinamide mononucleotide (NMN) deamidase PncC